MRYVITRDKRIVLILLLVVATLALYLTYLRWNFSPYIDIWPLGEIFWETSFLLVLISLLSYLLFDSNASIIIPLITQAFLVVVIPVLRHPNTLSITGPWDSAAHYSFAKWIISKGHTDISGNLYYSDQYGRHPGNGIIPAMLNLLSSIELGWCMNIVIVIVYVVYLLLIFALLDNFVFLKENSLGRYLWLLALFTLSVQLNVYYGGGDIGYIFVGSFLYVLIKYIVRKDNKFVITLGTLLIIFLGLLCVHLPTSVIIVAYVLIVALTLLVINVVTKAIYTKFDYRRKIILISLNLIFVFMIYELYADIFLFNSAFIAALKTIYSLYIRELVMVRAAMETRGFTLMDLLKYLISTYAKTVIIIFIILIHTISLLMKWHSLNEKEKTISRLLVVSYLTWGVGWAGFGSFISGMRAISLISFLLSLSLVLTYYKLYRLLVEKTKHMMPLILIVLGFSANFGLPFQPFIKSDGNSYAYTVFSQGGFSDLVLHPTLFMSSHTSSSYFLCLHPYIGFGICDLMWQTPRIPRVGARIPETSPEAIIKILVNYLNKRVVIPLPIRDRLIPAPIGYYELYEKPFHFLLDNDGAIIYHNGVYTLIFV
jgi:hypothetical protein